MKKTKLFAMLLALVMVAGLLAGCNGGTAGSTPDAADGSASTPGAQQSEPAAEPDAEPAGEEAASGEQLHIGYVVHVTGLDIMSVIEWGALAAGEDYDAKVTYIGPTSVDNAEQISMFEQLVATGVDGIVVIAGDPEVWDAPVQSAVDQGIPVLMADADAPTSARHAYFGVDTAQLGEDLGTAVRALTGDEGKIALGACVLGPVSHTIREDGVKAAFEGTAVEFLGPFETQEDATMNYNSWENIYTANPDLAAMVGLTAVETLNMAKVKADVGGDVVMAAYDPNAESLALMQEGSLDVCAGQNVFLAGYLPVQALCRSIQEGVEINAGENYYPGQIILAEDAAELIVREGGQEAMAAWYREYIEANGLKDFGLAV